MWVKWSVEYARRRAGRRYFVSIIDFGVLFFYGYCRDDMGGEDVLCDLKVGLLCVCFQCTRMILLWEYLLGTAHG